jgi:predicted DNA-binding protein with PD1-like motif
MIGKVTVGKSFRAIINYCLNDKVQEHNQEQVMKDRAEVLLYNKCFGNSKELVEQFNDVRQFNSKLSKPVLHITLSLAPTDQLTKNKLMEMFKVITITQPSEVSSFNGNIAMFNGKPVVHVHANIATEDGTTRGGHLLELVTGPTLEVFLTVEPTTLNKKVSPEFGAALIDPAIN